MKRIAVIAIALCLLLSGCTNWMDGSYSSVKPHVDPSNQEEKKTIPVYNYEDLLTALASLVESGEESGILSLQYGSEEDARADMEKAVKEVEANNPFAAYAVDTIWYTFGEVSGRNAASVRVTYLPDRVKTAQIQRVHSKGEAQWIIAQQLDECSSGVVLYFDKDEAVDFARFVERYALENPQTVMETPKVTVRRYPEKGEQQVVELEFSYQTSIGQLRSLQNKVAQVFYSAQQTVAGNWSEAEKCLRLYTFLMERYEYSIQTSVTPAYSLLLSGEGDSRAFAMVYAAMCSRVGVDCKAVIGTRSGRDWAWNAVQINGTYYFLDLLRCNESGVFALYELDQVKEYKWDNSLYPIV